MATTLIAQPASRSAGLEGISLAAGLVLAAWLLLVVVLGVSGIFVVRAGTPPLPIAIGVTAPLLLFGAWLRLSPSFRDFVLSLDLRFIAAMQAWRWAGLGFLDLYAYKVLPPLFALPAGLGDMAIGITAPWVILSLLRNPRFAASSAFRRWNLFGILDLVAALTLAAASSVLATDAPGEINMAPMQSLPLLLIPAYMVPLFLMLHAAALMQSRRISPPTLAP